MKRIPAVLAAMFLFGFAAVAFSQSLGDLAKKEKERREAVGDKSKVITNDDTPKYAAGAVTTGTPSASAPDKDKKPGDKNAAADKGNKGKEESDEPVDFEGRPESYWRQTFADARKKVSDLENEANVILLKIADLQNQFYRESDGFKQQSIQREIQKSFYEQDQNKENLAKAKDLLQDLDKEAKKSGALPGWTAPKH
jgi:hypothetical protein